MNHDAAVNPHPRYRIVDRIGKGGMGEVFRCLDRLTGQLVALKRVRLPRDDHRTALPHPRMAATGLGLAATLASGRPPAAEAPGMKEIPPLRVRGTVQVENRTAWSETVATPQEIPKGSESVAVDHADSGPESQSLRLHLTQEFRTLSGLRHPNIVSVLDYGFDEGQQPYFTMELLQAAVPLDVAAKDQPFLMRVGLLLQVTQALTYLHRRNVLHRDLKPSNILVISGPRGPQVKLLDFGLAMLTKDLLSQGTEVAGTIKYMAPEILVGAPPSVASDLFAVGVMAHELLVGSHPLGQRPTAALIHEFLGTAPIFSEHSSLGAELSAVLRRVLARNPSERYPDAAALAQELARTSGLPPPIESSEVRESFLQAATFVAREAELSTLRTALAEAASGHGSLWLVGGESGVGKSRLLEELRTFALVRGAGVVRGQAVSSAGSAFQVWQSPLRSLCLQTSLEDVHAGVLQAVVPDIATLIGRVVPEPPALDPQSAQTRLLYAIEKLFEAQKGYLLVLLEDLHWSDPASVAVLSHLVRFGFLSRQRILLVASYRDEERPELPSELPGTQRLKLLRLPMKEIASLSASMLGEAGKREDVVELIARETEGNAFFIVEAVRALAEEVGSLDKVGSSRIPSRLVAGGIQAVLARRLRRVTADARPFLSAAAVMGRELDLHVLRFLPVDTGIRWEADLDSCSFAAVLEAHENRWRFAHDKLREAVLAELSPDLRAQWHLRIGEAIERAYAELLTPHAAALAYHFKSAGVPLRAVRYSLQAGERALRSGAIQEAIRHLEEGWKLDGKGLLTKAERVHALGLLCQGYVGAGRPEETAQTLEQMLGAVGIPAGQTPRDLAMASVRMAAGHVLFRVGIRPAASAARLDDTERASLGEVVDACIASLGTVGYARTQSQYLHVCLALVTIAERLAEPARLAYAYTALASILSITPFDRLTNSYLRRAQELLEESPDPMAGEFVLRRGSAWVCTSRGEWETALKCLNEEMVHYRKVGDIGAELLALAQRFRLDESRGDIAAFREAQNRMEEVAQQVESAQHLCWVFSARGYLAMHAGQVDRARKYFLDAQRYEPQARDRFVSLYLGSNAALCALRCGDKQDARRRADATLQALLSTPSFGNSVADAVAPLVETYFLLWSERQHDPEGSALHLRLRQSLAAFRGMAAVFPICRPRALLWHGLYAERLGYSRIGDWLLERAREAAQRYRMPFDLGLAYLAQSELAHSRGQRATAQEAWQQARALLEQVEAHYYVGLVFRSDP